MRAKKSRRSVLLSGVVVAVLLFVVVLIAADRQIRPIMQVVSQYQGREIATHIITRSVQNALENPALNCDDLVRITYDMSGVVTSVQTDVTKMNQMQSQISLAVNTGMGEIKDSTIEIPLGTLSGLTYFNGQGPIIKLKIQQQGHVKTELASTFTDAGINQTLHQIILKVEAKAIAVIPTNYVEFDASSTYILAETVVVGNVPDGYTYVAGDNRDSLTKVNDYSVE